MIFDAYNKFSDDQAVTASAASTNIIDLAAVDSKIGSKALRAGALNLFVQITEAFNNLTSLKFELQSSVDEAFTSPIGHHSETPLLAAIDAVGDRIELGRVPSDVARYIRLYYTVTGTAPTTGKIFAALTADDQTV
jgi:hypothetical protein